MPTIQAPRSLIQVSPSHGFLKSHFAPAFFFLSPERRRALQTVYGFFRILDDAVDDAVGDPTPYLDAWRAVLREKRSHYLKPWGHEAKADGILLVVKTYDIPLFALNDFIDNGVALDLGSNRYSTPLDTERYCYGVAGTVGIACLPIFGAPVAEAKDFAVRLGIAVQWINTIRDVGIDARMNRIYIPKDHWDEFAVTETEILGGKMTGGLLFLLRHETAVARAHLRRAEELLPQAWKRELRPALIMGGIYSDLLDKVEKQGFPVFTKRVSLNIVEKAASTWRTLRKYK